MLKMVYKKTNISQIYILLDKKYFYRLKVTTTDFRRCSSKFADTECQVSTSCFPAELHLADRRIQGMSPNLADICWDLSDCLCKLAYPHIGSFGN